MRGTKIAFALALVIVTGALFAEAAECFTPLAWQPKRLSALADQNGNHAHDHLESLPAGTPVDILLSLNRCPEPDDLARLEQTAPIVESFHPLTAVAMENVPVDAAINLAQDPIVAFVEEDAIVFQMLDVSTRAIKRYASQEYSPTTIEDVFTETGSGVRVAVLDTGIDEGHETFPAGSVIDFADCTGRNCVGGNPSDSDGHGTHVAGIVAGRGSAGSFTGVAPGAGLIDVKIANAATTRTSGLMRGLKHLTSQMIAQPDVALLAFGDCTPDDGGSPLAAEVDLLVSQGVTVVTPMPNCNTCGLSPGCNLVSSPASATEAIVVGWSDDQGTIDRGGDDISPDSAIGPRQDGFERPDLVAPGVAIESAEAGTTSGYVDASGGSAAAAHVAGCLALLLEQDPQRDTTALRRLLVTAAEDFGPAGIDDEWGAGLLDCYGAMGGSPPPPPAPPLPPPPIADVRFEFHLNRSGNNPPNWASPDIEVRDPNIREGQPNDIRVFVENLGPAVASNVDVTIGIYNFSNQDQDYVVCTHPIAQIPVGQKRSVNCSFRPGVSGKPPGSVHACIKAEVSYTNDPDISNNRAQRNIDIEQAFSPAKFLFEVANLANTPSRMNVMPTERCNDCQPSTCCTPRDTPGCSDTTCQASICEVDPFCCEGAWDEVCVEMANQDPQCIDSCSPPACNCQGWDAVFGQPLQFDMGSGECPLQVEVELIPLELNADREIRIDVGVNGTPIPSDCCTPHASAGCTDATCEATVCELAPFCCTDDWNGKCVGIAEFDEQCFSSCLAGAPQPMNGVTLIGRLSCAVDDLIFTDQQTLSWSGSPYVNCPQTWDVAVGRSPFVLSEAQCAADELTFPQFVTGTETLAKQELAYYLVRAGGDDPGSWDVKLMDNPRDITVDTCPSAPTPMCCAVGGALCQTAADCLGECGPNGALCSNDDECSAIGLTCDNKSCGPCS